MWIRRWMWSVTHASLQAENLCQHGLNMHTIAIRVIKCKQSISLIQLNSARIKVIFSLRLKKAELLLMEEDWLWEHLKKVNMSKSILPWALREVADVTKGPLWKPQQLGEASWEEEGRKCHFCLQAEQEGGLWELKVFQHHLSPREGAGPTSPEIISKYIEDKEVTGHRQQVFIKGSWALWSIQPCSEPRSWGRWYPKVPSNLSYSVILWSLP